MAWNPEPYGPSAPSRARHPVAPAATMDVALRDLVARAARLRDGLAILLGAPLECAAILLGVPPPAIERARLALQDQALLAAVTARFAAATAGTRHATAPAPRPPAPRDPEQLIDAARRRSDGLSLLFTAAPETAAIAFGVHPDLIHGARAMAGRRADRQRN